LLLAAIVAAGAAATASGSSSSAAGLAYASGGTTGLPSVWVASASGANAHKVGTGSLPALSPNGKLVAAEGFGPNGPAFTIYSATGGPAHKIGDINKYGGGPFAWSPDSRYLAVGMLDTTATRKVGNSGVEIVDTQTWTVTKVASGVVQGVSAAPTGADRFVFGLSSSQQFGSKTNLFSVAPGAAPTQLTKNGTSYFPVWGARGIAFDSVRFVRKQAPAYSISLLSNGRVTSITHMKVNLLQDGLLPVAVSANGRYLVANFVGEDTTNAVTVDLVTHKTHMLLVKGVPPTGWGISSNGKNVLIDVGGFENPPQDGTVESIPFAGGKTTVLHKHGDEPNWAQ
jgi:hypothetical protein